ncbi:MAG: hypothetical protein COV67_10465 [Nitrospinae bacterium CG11_big_fil_rev_8_21_14_0_20_56_8]|nr:MAG: hypothetical protein COV67_10465 [Nitrospinae bacterium CG11_big_fil_rev_8_21_14_0_20_56_8]
MRKFSFLMCFVFLAAGCASEKMAARMAFPLVQGQYDSMQSESDLQLAERAIPSNLKLLGGLRQSDPDNPEILRYLAEGFCSYAFGFVREQDPKRASALYERGRNYALRGLQKPDLASMGLAEFKSELMHLERKDLPFLFWLGQCWGEWLMLNLNNPEAFADISRLQILLERNLELDPAYHFGGPHLSLGVFYGSRTKLLGGNPEKAKFHFEQSMQVTGGTYLLAPYLYAKTYAVQVQDRDLFMRLLDQVLSTPSDLLPAQRLSNEIAKAKAEVLLESVDDLF